MRPHSQIRRLSLKIIEYRRTLFAFAASGINQVFGSATNLLIGVYLVRHMVPAEFGLYNISFAVTITIAAIGNSIFLIPMTVGMPHDDSMARNHFMLGYISTSAVCMIFAGLAASLIFIFLVSMSFLNIEYSSFIFPIIISCLSFFLKDAMVQAGYNQGRESTTIIINLISAISILILIFISSLFVKNLTAPWAIMGYSISQLTALGVGYAVVFGRTRLPEFSVIRSTTGKLLGAALWPACASALSLLRAQAHTIVVAGVVGPAGVAAINASRLIFAPVQMAQPALVRAAMPRLVRKLRTDLPAFQRGTLLITGILGTLSVIYCSIILMFGPWVFPIVIGKGYNYSALMLLAWGSYITLGALRSGVELNQQALQRFKSLAAANLPACAVALIAAYALTLVSGPPGAVFGLALGEVTIIIFLFLRMRRST